MNKSPGIMKSRLLREASEEQKIELLHDLRYSGIRSIQSVQGLLAWCYFNVFFTLVPTVLPALPVIADNVRYLMFSATLCVALSWWRMGARVRLSAPIVFVMLLQLWLTICSYISHIQIGRSNDFETSNYFLLMVVLYYFLGSIFGQFWTGQRKLIPNLAMWLFFASAVVGFAQFVKIGPALQLAAIYNTFGSIENWGGVTSIRSVGLAGWPEWLTWQCLFGWAVIASRMFERPLKTWEFLVSLFFILVAYMPQSRIMYVSVLLVTVGYLFMLYKLDRKRAPVLGTLFGVGVLLMFTFGQEQLGYVLNTDLAKDETLRYRRETGWGQAYYIYDERPWVGIGPDNDLTWEVRRADKDKWAQGEFIDNGYLLLIAWGGLPAVALFIPLMMTAVGGNILVFRDKKLPLERRQLAFILGACFVFIWNNTFLNNGFTNVWLNCFIAYLGGLLQPNVREMDAERKELRTRMERLRAIV